MIYTTEEQPRYEAIWAVRSDSGTLQPFCRDKLFLSLYDSCKHRSEAIKDAGALTATVTKKLSSVCAEGVLEAQMIAQTVQVALNRFDKVASTHYRAFHSL